MNTPGNDRMHELLCAYLLDEVDASEKTQVEEALAASSDLRAERDRLQQTLGLVSSAYQGEEALSESAFASVLEQAEVATRPARPRFVLLRPTVMRAAAAVLVVVTGTWALVQRDGGEAGDQQVAVASKTDKNVSLEQETAQAPGRRDRGQGRLKAIGYGGSETERGAELDRRKAEVVERMRALGYAEGDEMQALQGLGYAGGDSSPSPSASTPRSVGYAQSDADGARSATPSPQEVSALSAIGYFGEESPVIQGVDGVASAQEEVFEAEGDPDMFADAPFDDKALDNAIGAGRGAGGKYGGRFGKKREQRARERLTPAEVGQLQALGYASGSSASVAEPSRVNAPSAATTHRGTAAAARPGARTLAGGAQAGGVVDGKDLKEQVARLDRSRGLDSADSFYLNVGDKEEAERSRANLEAQVRDWSEQVIQDCYPRPTDMPRDMYFRFWGDNSFELTELDRLSTFSVDVDTASYALARRYLAEGKIPTKAQIRTEEFLNSFDPDVPAPSEGTFAIQTELAPSRFGGGAYSMLRVGVRGREVSKSERKPLSITFVIDTSGSMRENDRLELVKHAVRLLVGELNGGDSIAIVSYSNHARIVLPLTSADRGGEIEAALYPLQPNGSTNAEAGLMLGYQVAQAGLDPERNHRVVFLSDGVANVGQTDQNRLAKSVRQNVDAGIYLNTIGVGMGNHNDVFLEQLADRGDGVCDYIDSAKAAKRAIVDRFTGAFETIASDVKIQVDFDPKQVHRYRLLGYENRAVADKDFRNDAVDAGEVGAGHQVVALYELELVEDAPHEAPLATVRLRFKAPKAPGQDPRESDVTEMETHVSIGDAKGSYAAASSGYRKSVVVAQFAEFLRRSTHARGDAFEALLSETAQLARELATPEFDEFLGMVKKAYQLGPPADLRGDLELTLDEFRRFQILRKELESLNKDLDGELLKELQERNGQLEQQLRNLIQGELDKKG